MTVPSAPFAVRGQTVSGAVWAAAPKASRRSADAARNLVGISHLQIDAVVAGLALRVLQVEDNAFLGLDDVLDSSAASRIQIGAVAATPAAAIGAGDSGEQGGSPFRREPPPLFDLDVGHVLAVVLADLVPAEEDGSIDLGRRVVGEVTQ